MRWYVQVQTAEIGSEFWLGMTAAMAALPIVLFSAIGGLVADRVSRRKLIVATQAALAVISLLFGFGVASYVVPMSLVLAFAAANGFIMSFDIPARQAFSVEMVGTEDLMNGIALNSAVFNLGRLLGPIAAGWAIVAMGIPACFVLNAVSFVAVIAALCLMRVDEQTRPPPEPYREALLVGFRTIANDKQLLSLVGCLAIVLITGSTYVTLLPAFAQYVLHQEATGYSWMLTANGLGSLLGALAVALLDSLEARKPAILCGIIGMGIGLIILGVSREFATACVALVLTGGGFLLFLAATNSTVQLSVSDDVRGRVMSIWVLVFGVCQPIGNAAAGWTASRIGTPWTFIGVGIGCFIAALLAAILLFSKTSPHRLAELPPDPMNEPNEPAEMIPP